MARNTRSRPRGDDDNTPDDIDDFFGGDDDLIAQLEALDPADIPQWISDNAGSFDDDDRATVDNWIRAQAGEAGLDERDVWRPAVQAADSLYFVEPAANVDPEDVESGLTPTVEGVIADQTAGIAAVEAAERQDVLDDAREDAIAAAAEIYGRTSPGVDPDLSDVEALVPEGLDPNERERWLTDVITQGRAQAVDERAADIQGTGASEEEARQLAEQDIVSDDLYGATEPDWLLQMNVGILSEQQKDRYVEYWNDAYGTNLSDFDSDLAPILARFDGTETEAQDFAASVLAAQEPLITHSIELPLMGGTRRVSYTEEQMADLRAMGYSNDAIVRLVRLAANGRDDAILQGAAGEYVDVRALAALVRYYGGGDEFGSFTESEQEVGQLEQELGVNYRGMTIQERRDMRALLEVRAGQGRNAGASAAASKLAAMDRIDQLFASEARAENHGQTPGILAARNNFNRGMEQYHGDELLSLVYAVDPNLAQRVAATGGDPEKLDWEDNEAVYNILHQGGVIDDDGMRLRQLESSTGFFGFFNTGGGRGGGGGGGAGPVRRMVDPAAVQEQVQQLWSRMFLADVDDATVQAITANLQAQLDAAPEGMSFDASARIMAFLKGQDVYDELYRHKPEGMAEEEYQSQFAAGVADMIGNELDPEALKSGMRTGDYQAAVGRAGASEKLLTNSTLRGRWAQAKQVLDRFS